MNIFNELAKYEYLRLYILFGISIYLFINKINYQYLHKKIHQTKKKYLITNSNDSIDYNLLFDVEQEQYIYTKNDNNFDNDELDYFYYC